MLIHGDKSNESEQNAAISVECGPSAPNADGPGTIALGGLITTSATSGAFGLTPMAAGSGLTAATLLFSLGAAGNPPNNVGK